MKWTKAAQTERDTMKSAQFVGLEWVARRAEDLATQDYLKSRWAMKPYQVCLRHWRQARYEWSYDTDTTNN